MQGRTGGWCRLEIRCWSWGRGASLAVFQIRIKKKDNSLRFFFSSNLINGTVKRRHGGTFLPARPLVCFRTLTWSSALIYLNALKSNLVLSYWMWVRSCHEWGGVLCFVCLSLKTERAKVALVSVQVWGELCFLTSPQEERKLTEVCVPIKGEIFVCFVVFAVFYCYPLLPSPPQLPDLSCGHQKGGSLVSLLPFCSLAVSDFFFFWLHFSAQKCHCLLLLSRQANGFPDSAPSHQHGQRLLLEVDQWLRRLGARLQAQLWRSEGSPRVSVLCEWSDSGDGRRLKI